MALLLIIEDDPKETRKAADLARGACYSEVQALMSSKLAVARFADAIEAGRPLPDVVVLDLDLSTESGFELLRFIHGNRLMPRVQVVVWTVMGDHEREICRLFGVVEFVSKQDGPKALLEVLARINPTHHEKERDADDSKIA